MAAKKRSKAKAGKRTGASSARAPQGPAKKAKATAARVAAKAEAPVASTGKKAKKKASAKPPAAKQNGSGTSSRARASAAEQASASTLGEGDRAPSFELPDQTGSTVSSESLAGHPYVLYFYPKDDTPGCTTEACGFRDSFAEFEGASVRVLGVSPDSVASHQKFVAKYGLPFTLLSDSDRALASAYGVWALKRLYGRESMGIVRSTFLIDGDGVIRKVWRGVRVNGHVADVQAAAAQLG